MDYLEEFGGSGGEHMTPARRLQAEDIAANCWLSESEPESNPADIGTDDFTLDIDLYLDL